MKKIFILLSIFFLAAGNLVVLGQGCSDAGFCTLSSLKGTSQEEQVFKNFFRFGLSNGLADNDVTVWTAYLEYQRSLNNRLSLNLKLNFMSHTDGTTSTSGLADIYLNGIYALSQAAGLTLGVKIPLSDAGKMAEGMVLPMDFQTSLGTLDLILGATVTKGNLTMSLALQQPLGQNKNSFLPQDYPADSKFAGFIATNKYNRKGDVLLRATYTAEFRSGFKLIPGILAIYHLGNDQYSDASGDVRDITGSSGVTLNGNIFLVYRLSKSSFVEITLAAPFVTRTTRPDGLTRGYVITLDYRILF